MITAIDQNTALVLIDLQKGITGMGRTTAPHPVGTVLENAVRLVDAFHAAGQPVVIVNVIPAAGAAKLRAEKSFGAMTPPPGFADIATELQTRTRPGDIFVTKRTWGAFFETPLHAELQKRGVTQIVLGGISTSIGVESTARGASERGYNIAFATDAMTDTDAAAHGHSLQNIFPRIGELGTTAEVIAMLATRQ